MRTDDYKQSPYTPAVPDGEFDIGCDSSLLVHTWREYAGNRVYDNGVLSRLLFDGGYVSFRDSVPTYHYYIRDYLDKQEEKIVTLPEVIVVAPACPRDKGELLIPTFNTNINYDDYKKQILGEFHLMPLCYLHHLHLFML